jgi:hypothetical protein
MQYVSPDSVWSGHRSAGSDRNCEDEDEKDMPDIGEGIPLPEICFFNSNWGITVHRDYDPDVRMVYYVRKGDYI